MITIDGNYEEGGGQIVRTALALSALTGKAFEVNDIRKGRKQPGLKAQHLHCIKALEKLCSAKAQGAELGSEYLKFEPGELKGGTVKVDIGTAGSIPLLLQSILIPSIFAKDTVRLKLIGGTDTKWAMPSDFISNVFIPHLKKFADIEYKLLKRGYYPKGGGNIEIKIKPKYNIQEIKDRDDLKLNLENQGKLMIIRGISSAAKFLETSEVAERQAKGARSILSKFNIPIKIDTQYSDTLSPGSCIVLYACFSETGEDLDPFNPIILGADSLGEKGKRAEQVGQDAATKLITEINSKAPVDQHLADNLIPLLAITGGKIRTSEITKHTLSNIYTTEKFLDRKIVAEDSGLISVE